MDTIFIENLTYTGIHGVYKQEHHIPQQFNIWITMEVDTSRASQSDNVEDTVDYKVLQEFIKTVIEGEHHCLIEKITGIIADKILEDYRVKSCEVTIKKLDAFETGTPGVTFRKNQKIVLLTKKYRLLTKNLIEDLEINNVVVLPLLSDGLCKKMKEAAKEYQFIPAEKVYSKTNIVEQNFTYFRDYPHNNFLWHVSHELEQLVNDASQYYNVSKLGISLHKDESRFRNIIVICVLEGESEFCTLTEQGEKSISSKPGDVIFIRAPGFMNTNIRPVHAVKNIISLRLSVTFRQELPA
jgi:dihydroneopterin aldolase